MLVTCRARTTAQTGVEMEALTGVAVALLTIYDMCKAVDKTMQIRRCAPGSKNEKVSDTEMMQITVGIITVSDRASQGQYDDLGGPAIEGSGR